MFDFNAPLPTPRETPTRPGTPFFITYTATSKPTPRMATHRKIYELGTNGLGQTIYGNWVLLIPGYTNFDNVEALIQTGQTVDGLKLIAAYDEHQVDNGDLDPTRAAKLYI